MSELINFYEQQARAQCSNIPWLAGLQQKALSDFSQMGFPARHEEDWKYTAVDSFLKERFVSPSHLGSLTTKRPLDVPVGLPIALINGEVTSLKTLAASLPPGVIIQPMAEALVSHAEKIKPYLNHILKQKHGFHALNTAMLHTGLFIYLPEGVALTHPLCLSHWQDQALQATYIRHLLILEKGSSLNIIEDYQGEPGTTYFTNTITEAYLAERATFTHYKLQRESKGAYHVGHLAVNQRAGSRLNSHSFSIGGKWVRSDITIALQGPEAECSMNGIYAPADGQHIDHHTVVTHEVPHCRSAQDYKGILSGKSRAVFNGQVIVAKNADQSEAKQQNKNLLLSANAEVDTKPQLDIFAHDVICTHGATVGQLDEEALFYLATRGIGRELASRYLVQGFASENLQALGSDTLVNFLSPQLDQQLG